MASNSSKRTPVLLLAGAAGFVLLYLAVDFVTPNFASSSLPLPNAPAAQTQAWYASNQLAAVLTGVLQLLSVTGLAVFVTVLRGSAPGRAVRWGYAAVALMVLSCVLSWTLAAVAGSVGTTTVDALRTALFIGGGTAHVAALGVFVLLASRAPGFGKSVRVLAWVVVVPSVASLVSLVVFQGAALILLGRLLAMVWTVTAAIAVTRHTRLSRRSLPA